MITSKGVKKAQRSEKPNVEKKKKFLLGQGSKPGTW